MKSEKKANEILIARLQYKMQRYKSMGQGVACQVLNSKIQKLMAQNEKV